MYYLLFYLIGIITALFSAPDVTRKALQLIEPITLTALIASLAVAFAGFAKEEGWQKFALKYFPAPLFGAYSVALFQEWSLVGMAQLVCTSGVHVAYWTSSIHSRQYRLQQFTLGCAAYMPATAQLIAMLNAQGRSHEADKIVVDVLSRQPNEALVQKIAVELANQPEVVKKIRCICGVGLEPD